MPLSVRRAQRTFEEGAWGTKPAEEFGAREIDGSDDPRARQVETEIENVPAQIQAPDLLAGERITLDATPQAIEYRTLFEHKLTLQRM